MQNEVVELYLDDIIPNRFQPREKFDETALKELATSIKEHGVIQPIIVRKIGEKFEIIAGERRYKASALAGLTKIPAIIRNLDDKEASKVALLENLQRKDLTAIEEARTYQKILELDSMTQEELGKTMGKSQAAIANKLRLLSLTDEVQEALLNDQISERHARSLLAIENPNEQVEMLNRVIRGRMTVRELDHAIKEMSPTANISMEENMIEKESNAPKLEDLLKNPIEFHSEKESFEETKPGMNPPKTESSFSTFTPPASPVMIQEEDELLQPTNTNSNNNSLKDANFVESFKLKDAINLVRDVIPELRHKGMQVSVEETDMGGKYQIIININKEDLEK